MTEHTREPLMPGEKVFVVDEYANACNQKTIVAIKPGGVLFKDRVALVNFANVHRDLQSATAFMIARAERIVALAEQNLANAKDSLRRVRRKLGASPAAREG